MESASQLAFNSVVIIHNYRFNPPMAVLKKMVINGSVLLRPCSFKLTRPGRGAIPRGVNTFSSYLLPGLRAGIASLVIGFAAMSFAQDRPAGQVPPPASELFKPPIVLDGHVDVLLRLVSPDTGRTLDEPGFNGQANFANWKAGGTNAVFFAVWIDPRQFRGKMAEQRAEQLIGVLHQQLRLYPNRLALCDTADEVRRTVAADKTAALIGIEGGIAINDNLANIERFRRMGVRYMTLTWRGNLAWAGSSQEVSHPFRRGETMEIVEHPSSGGLTEFGRRVVAEMNRVGMCVDLSHVSDETFFDAIKISTRPVIVSHSNARALSDHKRNITDTMLRALKANGGVMGINLWYEMLEPSGKGSKTAGAKRVTVEDVLDQIDHIVKVAGIDHVGLGTDFEGMSDLPQDLQNAAQLPKIFEGMRKRGYSEADIRKFAGENFLRVLKANEGPQEGTLH